MGAKKMNRKADRWGPTGSESSLASQRARVVQGWAGMLGLLELVGHARGWEKGKGLAGRLGWLAWVELLAARPSLFISLFPFLLFFVCLLKAFAHQRIN